MRSANDAASDKVAAGLAADVANNRDTFELLVHLREQLDHLPKVADKVGAVRSVHTSVFSEDGKNLLDLAGLFGDVVVKDGRIDFDRINLDGLFDRNGARIGCQQPDFLGRELFVRGIDFIDFQCRGCLSFNFVRDFLPAIVV